MSISRYKACFTFVDNLKITSIQIYFSLELLCNTDYHDVYSPSHQAFNACYKKQEFVMTGGCYGMYRADFFKIVS